MYKEKQWYTLTSFSSVHCHTIRNLPVHHVMTSYEAHLLNVDLPCPYSMPCVTRRIYKPTMKIRGLLEVNYEPSQIHFFMPMLIKLPFAN